FPSRNMFHSIVARAAEIHYALLEANRLLEDYTEPEAPFVPAVPRVGIGYGCTEAPRGLLWHRYDLDAAGQVLHARIVPPTSQNQARMEADLRHSLETLGLDRDDETLRQQAEMVIRNYDPCISCATHFLKVRVERR
ncbi:nickel-dependent hydrogenase large subunit, partial [Acidithiobacillus sp.]